MSRPQTARNAEIIAFAKCGVPPHEIAPKFSIKPHVVYSVLKKARSRGEKVPIFRRGPARRASQEGMFIRFDQATRDYLRASSACRAMTIHELLAALMGVIAEDDMVTAILDDGMQA